MEEYKFTQAKKVYPMWVYHADLSPKIIQSDELSSHIEQGWADNPVKFCKVADFGIDPGDDVRVQALGETVQALTDSLNGQINLDKMTKKELIYYADKHLGMDIDEGKSKKGVLILIQGKLGEADAEEELPEVSLDRMKNKAGVYCFNLDKMTKKELIYYADKYMDLDIGSAGSKEEALTLIEKKLDDEASEEAVPDAV